MQREKSESGRQRATLTGYPSIDKPWLKYYSEEAINMPLPEKTLYRYLYENNKDYLRNIALNYFGRKITYGALFENIEKAAKGFSALGVGKGDIVTIMSMHTPETIYCIYALNRLGAVAHMVYMTLSEQEILSTIKTTESKALIVLSVALEKINQIFDRLNLDNVIVVSPSDSMNTVMRAGYRLKTRKSKFRKQYIPYGRFIKMGIGNVKDAPYNPNEPAVIVYTSGSTGEPKGVVLGNDNLNAVVHQYQVSGMQFKRGDTFFNMLPPYLGFGISVGLHLALALGMQEILWILPEPTKVAKAYIDYKPNHFASAPIVIEEIVKRFGNHLEYIKTFSVGGESPTEESISELNDMLKKRGSQAKYITGYGLTETSATICTQMNDVYKIGSLGIPMVCTNIKIMDTETGKELKYNEVGEMWFASPNIMQSYYENEKAKIIWDNKKMLDEIIKKWMDFVLVGYDEKGKGAGIELLKAME